METKICKKCNINKEIINFTICKKSCDDCEKLKRKEYYEKNKDRINETYKKYYNKAKDNINEKRKPYSKEYANNNKDKLIEYRKSYYKLNKTKIIKRCEDNRKKRYNNDPLYKLKFILRRTANRAFKQNGYKKNSITEKIIGCSYEFFLEYIISQFEPWMTLENHGIYTGNYNETWQIDHIQPISNASSEEEVIRLSHYTNLRPICSRKNLEKSNK